MGISPDGEYSDVLGDNFVAGSVSVSTTQAEAKAGGSTLSKRELLYIENRGPQKVYYGPTGVTTSNGAILEIGGAVFLEAGESVKVYVITSTSTSTVVIHEFA